MKKITIVSCITLAIAGILMVSVAIADQSREAVLKQFTPVEIEEIGKNVYQTTGENTCLKCHRSGGEGEGWAGAADLRKPYKWNAFTTLGGYEALEKNPEEFRKKFYTILEALAAEGGIKWNLNFKKTHPDIVMDWSKSEKKKTQYDMMMWGVAQAAVKKKIADIQKDLESKGKKLTDAEMKDLAVYAVMQYIKGFEEPQKKPDGTSYPKIHA